MERNRIILDTSAYSSFLRGNAEVKRYLQDADEIYLNPIIIGELLSGFAMGKNEKKNRTLFQRFLSSPRVKIIDIDEETSERYAIIINHIRTKGTPVPMNDLWIAASAMQYGLKVLTADSHFLKVTQIITEYFQVLR